MIYRVLGELEVHDPDTGRPLTLPTGHRLNVLAALLIQPNTRLSHIDLLRAGWGIPDVQEAQLHKAVSALRGLLRPIGRDRDLVTHQRFGYELRAGEDDLDMLMFERLADAAEQAKEERRVDDEIGLLRRALRLWRGPEPLSNVPVAKFATITARLRQRRKRAAVRLATLRIGRGEFDSALNELQPIAIEFPADHQLHKLLMIALYRSGHDIEAIDVYERYARALLEESGEQDPALRRLKYAMGAHQDWIVTELTPTLPPAVPAPAVPKQLPPAPPGFVGRREVLAELTWLLDGPRVPVMVVPGPGGIGKTALMLRAAHDRRDRFPDGQLWAELRGASDAPAEPAEILAQFLRAFEVPVIPESVGERAALYRTLLADRRVLVVLDDAADGAQIRHLIPASDRCAVVVSARRHLPDVAGAHHVGTLEPLADPDAAALFRSIVTASQMDLSAEDEAVRDVVRLCGGLPLALRIAAALRVRHDPRSTAELARLLAAQGPAAYAFGDESLARTLETGLAPLGEAPRRLFVDLGLLPLPTFGNWTAAALSGDPATGAAALAELAAGYLVETLPAPVRHRFHDLTREYAHRRGLVERPGRAEREALLGRVCAALLTLTRRAHAGLYGGDFEVVHSDVPPSPEVEPSYAEVDADPQAWFRVERLNIRAAVDLAARLGLVSICWDLAVSAHEFYTIHGYVDDWYATHTVALQACRDAGDRRGEGIVLAALGQPALVAGGRRAGISGVPELERAVELLGGSGDEHGLAIAQRTLANALRRSGQLTRPLALFRDALAGYQAAGDTVGRCQTLRFIGQTHLDRGDRAAAVATLEDAARAAEEFGRPRLVAQARYWAGQACLAADDLAGAERAFAAVRELCPPESGLGYAYALHGLGDLALRRGEHGRARRDLTDAAEIAHENADANLEGRVRLSLAGLWRDQGRSREWVAELNRAAACFVACDAPALEVTARARLAEAGDPAAWARVESLYAQGDVPPLDRMERRPERV